MKCIAVENKIISETNSKSKSVLNLSEILEKKSKRRKKHDHVSLPNINGILM